MLAWMLYVLVMTLLLSGAALAAERAARVRRAPIRWIWVAAMVSSLAGPVLIASVSIQVPSLSTPTVAHRVMALRELTSVEVAPLTWVREHPRDIGAAQRESRLLQRGWIVFSVALLLVLLLSGTQMNWRKQRWRMGVVAGSRVYIAPNAGPAVVGLLDPRIVIPDWLVQGSPASQALAVAHEQAHLRSHDPQLLAAAFCLVVLMPWNLPLWWQLHRLRCAIEADCDARVLAGGVDPRRYAELLGELSERPVVHLGPAAAMSAQRSSLRERIALMLRDPVDAGSAAIVAFACLALVLFGVAIQVTPPNFGSIFGTQRPVWVAPEVLDRYVGYYWNGSRAIWVITRNGTHLLMKCPLYDPGEIVPDSDGVFLPTGAPPVTFVQDAHGQTTALLMHPGPTATPVPWVRVDAATGQRILADAEAKYRNQIATPGSEATLRRVIEGLLAGNPDYGALAPPIAELVRNSSKTNAEIVQMGAIRSIEFRGVSRFGHDVYEVHQDGGTSGWFIDINPNGLVDDLSVHRW